MLRKLLVATLAGLLVNFGYVSYTPAQNKEAVPQVEAPPALSKKEIKRAQKVRKAIRSIGVGRGARTAVSLADKTEFKGYVSEATDDYFVITAEKTGTATRIDYAQVEKIRMWPTVTSIMKRDFTTPSSILKKVAIGTIIVVGLVTAVCGISRRCQE